MYDRAIVSAMGTATVKWKTLSKQPGFWLRAVDSEIPGPGPGILWALEHFDYEVISEWCRENNCGKRMSYDQFQFDTEDEMTWFLLRWS